MMLIDIDEYLSMRGYTRWSPLAEVNMRNETVMELRCSRGHAFNASFNDIWVNKGCPRCEEKENKVRMRDFLDSVANVRAQLQRESKNELKGLRKENTKLRADISRLKASAPKLKGVKYTECKLFEPVCTVDEEVVIEEVKSNRFEHVLNMPPLAPRKRGGGFNVNKKGVLYVTELRDEHHHCFKVGITNHSTMKRFSVLDHDKIIRSWEYSTDGATVKAMEDKILLDYDEHKEALGKWLQSGNTELLKLGLLQEVLSLHPFKQVI